MSTPLNANLTGTFVSNGLPVNISIPSGYDEIELINLSSVGSTSSSTPVMKAFGSSNMPAGAAYYALKTASAATLALTTTTASGGFTFVSDSGATSVGPNLSGISAISQANPAAVSTSNTGSLVGGNTVRVIDPVGMLQIGGMDFTIDTVVANTSFNLSYLNASGFAQAGTGGSVSLVNTNSRFYPQWRYITAISQASSAVVQLSVTHGYTVGQLVRVICPSSFGMTQINNLLGTVTAVDNSTNTITLNINSSGFTAFSFPTTATAGAGTSFALIVPVGEAATAPYANNLQDSTVNTAITGVTIGSSVQTSGETYQWIAKNGISL